VSAHAIIGCLDNKTVAFGRSGEMRLILLGGPGAGQGHPGDLHHAALWHFPRSRPATCCAPRSRQGHRWGSRRSR
jgi:hypothetical protein